MKKILGAALLAAVLFTSCKKDDNKDCPETQAALVGNYKLTKVTLNGADVTSQYDACELSGVLNLKADNTVTYTETSTCNGNGTGAWNISGNMITISHTGNGDDYSGTVSNGLFFNNYYREHWWWRYND